MSEHDWQAAPDKSLTGRTRWSCKKCGRKSTAFSPPTEKCGRCPTCGAPYWSALHYYNCVKAEVA